MSFLKLYVRVNREMGIAPYKRIRETQNQLEMPVWFSDQTFNVHEVLKLKVLENLEEIP
jgi:hypothetical protein